MRAIQIVSLDGPEAVQLNDIPTPEPGEDQLLVRVRAAGVSFPELLQTRGLYQFKPPVPFVPGSEVAGDVVSAPEGSGFAAGDRVAAMVLLGGFGEYAVAPLDGTFALPEGLSYAEGAALPLNYLTSHFALVTRAHIQPGEVVLVHGAAGGVGTAAIQTAKAFGAGRVIAVASTEEKRAVALDAGADDAVPADDFLAAVKALDGFEGVDIVVDPVGGDRFTDSLRSLRRHGRLLVIGFADEGNIPEVKVNRLLLRNTTIMGVGWGEYALTNLPFLREQWAALLPHIESGVIKPPVGAEFPLEDAARALTLMDGRGALGKIVLTTASD
ncbi:MAG TPA: NADPH:quinone oxidoreductase family protein [Aeromicrobium sp.]|nr:NADPH:quinone oxidoreductase family protein [Aeromicrobium sp.]